jgi:hypothetical protein
MLNIIWNSRLPKLFFLVFFILIAILIFLMAVKDNENSSILTPDRCEISGLIKNCSQQPTLKITRKDGLWLDDARGSSQSQEVCKSRAKEFYEWCNSSLPITASFFHDGKLVESSIYPIQIKPSAIKSSDNK